MQTRAGKAFGGKTMMQKIIRRFSRANTAALAALALGLFPSAAWAASSPQRIGFQGKLLDLSNNPREGAFDFTFRIFNVPTGGAALWSEAQTGVQVTNGVFSVELGGKTALWTGLFTNASAYLEVEVSPDPPMSPRQLLLMSPVAFRALLADDLVSGNTNYIQVTTALQANAVFHVSSGTVAGRFLATGPSSFTATGNQVFSLNTASGIRVQGGTLLLEGQGGLDAAWQVKAGTVVAQTGLFLPQGAAINSEGAARWDAAANLLYIGTGTSNKTMADTDSGQTLTNKTLNSTGGNLVDATHLRTRVLSGIVPTDGMTLQWDNGAAEWRPVFAATITVVAVPWTPGQNSSAWGNNTTWFSTGTVYLTPFTLSGRIALNHVRYRVTTAVAGVTGDVGIYNSGGTLVANGGANSADFTIASAQAVVMQGAPKVLLPGQYYFGFTATSASGNNPRIRCANLVFGTEGVNKGLGFISGSGGSTLPSSVNLGTIVDGWLVPFMSAND